MPASPPRRPCDGATSISWDTAATWNPAGAPGAGGLAIVNGAGAANQPTRNVASDAPTATNSSAGTLTLANVLASTKVTGGILTSDGLTISGDLSFSVVPQARLNGELNGLVVGGTATLDGALNFDATGVNFGADHVEAEVLRAGSTALRHAAGGASGVDGPVRVASSHGGRGRAVRALVVSLKPEGS